ncbi:helix-turn-helix domain-containing protein [Chryseolinea lacunae]|uniref:Helix-turn-helix domain-containing protein n=1 Tax=Chryseolinea lacunae TaxID=2801331 RepID=A0ABS1KKJ8_9BACT|nr:helix-turn-helix domain-containing protein [Chryseolinea lacunae]MBL0739983.1 helix-turn-helix domain-containing protein [Chryseolinea lacunae]
MKHPTLQLPAMPESPQPESSFLIELTAVVEKNIANEQFGVSELADAMNMSRSNLLRKVKKETNLSVSQLINQVRLKRAMELLRQSSLNVSEVSHQVGFNSTSYFIKCFREYYGYPPGEAGRRDVVTPSETAVLPETNREVPPRRLTRTTLGLMLAVGILVLTAGGYFIWSRTNHRSGTEEISIAVLPFKNDSNDSSNVYLINGLMEATLNNLQKIEDLRVISRTSVEKYRNASRSIPEMAKELNVKYFVEGSGQKIGDRIVLNIQLIDGETDKHLWSNQYRREAKDIFELQQEIAKNISQEIEVIITPEEERRIEKKPTDDLVAYDYFLKGKDLFYRDDLIGAIPWLNKAIEKDPKFSLAYATATMVYYYLDIFDVEKKHTADIDNYAEKAILYEARSSESMIAKALSFAQKRQYELSIPYFEKALEYDPHSGLVLHFLTEFYNIHVPNPAKYLEYAIQKVKADKGADSVTTGFNYFHLGNALLQNGFLDDAMRYATKSLQLNAKGFFAGYVYDYTFYAKDRDAGKARDRLLARWKKDTLRFDVLQEVGKMNTMLGDYKAATACYDRAVARMNLYHMDIFKHEYLRFGVAYARTGQKEKAERYLQQFKTFADNDRTMYKDLYLTTYYAYTGEANKAMKLFERFATQDNFIFWVLLLRIDPVCDDLRKDPKFDAVMKEIERKYWKKHAQLNEQWGEDFRDL